MSEEKKTKAKKRRANSLIVLVETLNGCSLKPTILWILKPKIVKTTGQRASRALLFFF